MRWAGIKMLGVRGGRYAGTIRRTVRIDRCSRAGKLCEQFTVDGIAAGGLIRHKRAMPQPNGSASQIGKRACSIAIKKDPSAEKLAS